MIISKNMDSSWSFFQIKGYILIIFPIYLIKLKMKNIFFFWLYYKPKILNQIHFTFFFFIFLIQEHIWLWWSLLNNKHAWSSLPNMLIHIKFNGYQHSQFHTSNVIFNTCTQKYNQMQIMFEKHSQYFGKLIGDDKSMG